MQSPAASRLLFASVVASLLALACQAHRREDGSSLITQPIPSNLDLKIPPSDSAHLGAAAIHPRREEIEKRIQVKKSGMKIVRNPPDSKLADLGVRSWPRWAFAPSKFPWTYSANETSYILEGKAKIYPEGSDEGVVISAGDLADFPKGMSCTWEVSAPIYKHYKFND
ncbi:unnamed protein product [Linum tenue]|uniref:(S)-ureidoglycine aminohydrolase cupin domain-containing protein n=1 Tax=Linum tenue TaxID=586396 RepID=A0AAV0QE59_9ROSI|nr:unnamed protein product [Linum tenue]